MNGIDNMLEDKLVEHQVPHSGRYRSGGQSLLQSAYERFEAVQLAGSRRGVRIQVNAKGPPASALGGCTGKTICRTNFEHRSNRTRRRVGDPIEKLGSLVLAVSLLAQVILISHTIRRLFRVVVRIP